MVDLGHTGRAITLLFLIAGIFYFGVNQALPGQSKYCNSDHGELLIGHKMMHHYLGKEAQLRFLHVLRQATFRGPTGELKRLLTQIHQTSSKRRGELEELWKLEPVIEVKHAPASKIGQAIQDTAEFKGAMELTKPNIGGGSWNVRFYFLQSQATRMIAAISSSTEGLETNKKRAKWLKEVAQEFEGLREQLVQALLHCDLGGDSITS